MPRFAGSAVTCRQAEMRMPFRGWFLMNSLRMICRTFIDWLAHSMRFLPRSASSMFLISQLIAAVDITFPLRCYLAGCVGAGNLILKPELRAFFFSYTRAWDLFVIPVVVCG